LLSRFLENFVKFGIDKPFANVILDSESLFFIHFCRENTGIKFALKIQEREKLIGGENEKGFH